MASGECRRVLFVDDEQNVLDGIKRSLRGKFDLSTALKATAGLVTLRTEGPFAAVVTDLRMPSMDGVAFLARVREMAPDTVRLMLSGNADLEAAIDAINKGSIFRLLQKPCPKDVLIPALEAAVEQHRLITSEKVLLEQTLHGAVKTLGEVLSLANPTAFGRGTRAKQYVSEVLNALEEPVERWSVEVAAMLSQIGCVTLPEETVEKLCHGRKMNAGEREMVSRLPRVAEKLVAHIPRLEPVSEILKYQSKGFNGEGIPRDGVKGDKIPWGARLLRIVLDFEALKGGGASTLEAFETLRARKATYDAELLEVFATARGATAKNEELVELDLNKLRVGMVFAEDARTEKGTVIVAQGQEVTESLLTRLSNFRRNVGIKEPLRVIVSHTEAAEPEKDDEESEKEAEESD